MPASLSRWLAPGALCAAVMAAQAQGFAGSTSAGAAAPARPDPLDAKASVPALTYRSSFARYRGFGDDKPISWREANASVARIGGWRVYAREAQLPETDPAAVDPKASSPRGEAGPGVAPRPLPMAPGHAGHPSR